MSLRSLAIAASSISIGSTRSGAAVDDAVADRDDAARVADVLEPVENGAIAALMIELRRRRRRTRIRSSRRSPA